MRRTRFDIIWYANLFPTRLFIKARDNEYGPRRFKIFREESLKSSPSNSVSPADIGTSN